MEPSMSQRARARRLLGYLAGAPALAARGLIQVYRHTVAALIGLNCRHLPTCSNYADEALSLPPLRNLGARFRAGIGAGSCALVPALALRPLARHQLRRRGRALARPLSVSPHARRAQAITTVRGA